MIPVLKHPGHVTKDDTIGRDLRRSLHERRVGRVAECLSSLDDLLPDDDATALRLATMVVNAADESSMDAAFWRAAEMLYHQFDGSEDGLIKEPLYVRAMYLGVAVRTVRSAFDVLYGHLPRPLVEQAVADLLSHKEQLAQMARRVKPYGSEAV